MQLDLESGTICRRTSRQPDLSYSRFRQSVEDILTWSLGPKRSVNPPLAAEILILTYLLIYLLTHTHIRTHRHRNILTKSLLAVATPHQWFSIEVPSSVEHKGSVSASHGFRRRPIVELFSQTFGHDFNCFVEITKHKFRIEMFASAN